MSTVALPDSAAARERVEPHVYRTPMLTSRTLSEETGLDVRLKAEIVDPERVLAWRSEDGKWVWSFVLAPDGEGTRLVSRNRIALDGSLGGRLGMAVMEPGSWVMERKMLRGIKERAEKLAG